MATTIAGIAFLLACLLSVPLAQRFLHERAVRRLAMDGVAVVPGFWRLSGLRFERPGWQGVVSFEAGGIGGTGRGHLRIRAEVRDRREFGPEALARLEQLGGRVRLAGDGAVEIDGPFFTRPEDLRRFLEACDSLVAA